MPRYEIVTNGAVFRIRKRTWYVFAWDGFGWEWLGSSVTPYAYDTVEDARKSVQLREHLDAERRDERRAEWTVVEGGG